VTGAATEIVTAVLVLVAALMCFAAGVGLLRFPDVLSRLHAATKPQILGLICVTLDVAVNNLSVGTVTLCVAIVAFQLLTAPMAAHLVARAAYEGGRSPAALLLVDELGEANRRGDRSA
jgi:multicomponent Na+:H+ antiporter subunit G